MNYFRLLAAESDSHVCVHSLSPYYGNATNPGAQVPFNFHLMIITHKDRLVNSVDFGIQFWFEVVPKNSTPNWVVRNALFSTRIIIDCIHTTTTKNNWDKTSGIKFSGSTLIFIF